MNCPSRTDEPPEHEGWNQNPAELAADTTTRQDLNGIVNLRTQQNRGEDDDTPIDLPQMDTTAKGLPGRGILDRDTSGISANQSSRIKDADEPQSFGRRSDAWRSHKPDECPPLPEPESASKPNREGPDEPRSPSSVPPPRRPMKLVERLSKVLVKYSKFIGPGFMISVAYIDPGNYSTDVSAGAATKYKLLFIVLMSNIFAIVLQSLAVRLGTVTGLNLAENCRTHLPRWLNITLYIFGEGAIIATDIAEVSSM